MSGAGPAGPQGAPPAIGAGQWLIAFLVAFAAFMEVLDTTIANVALPYIAGGMGVSNDEASWVVTTYLVSNAVSLTVSSFMAHRFGRKSFFVACLVVFTISSVLCGMARNLEALLLFRVLQGLGGGGMVPVAQSILATTFPPEKRGQAFALFGIAVVVAPVVGPTLGGWISDNISWHWCFLVNGPVGVIAITLSIWLLPDMSKPEDERREEAGPFDLVGFILVATFLGALEVILDRGLDDDWFASSFIVAMTAVCALAFVAMIPWELSRRSPVIDIRMVATRQFGTCFVVMLVVGGILLGTTQVLPQLLQLDYGYTATWAGLVLSPGGLVTMMMMLITGRLLGLIQPKYLIALGALLVALSMHQMTDIYEGTDFRFFAASRMILGLGLPLIFLSITTASYNGIGPEKTDQASALINVARNTGGSIGVSLSANVLAHREQFHQSRLVETVVPSNMSYQEAMQQLTGYFMSAGSNAAEAHQQAIGWIGRKIAAQSSLLAYIDLFWVLMTMALATIPLAFTLRGSAPGSGPAMLD